MFKDLLKKILWCGIPNESLYEDAKRVEFSNILSLFFSAICLFYCVLYFYFYSYLLSGIILTCIGIYILCIMFNKWGKVNWARSCIMINTTLTIYITTAITGEACSGQFFFVFLFPLGSMLFKENQKSLKFISLSLPILAYIILEVTGYTFFYHVVFPDYIVKFLSMSVFVIVCIILYFMFQFYLSIFHHVRKSLNQALSLYSLTEREIEIISVVIKGKNNKELADILFIEECTVKNHLKNIYKKLNVKSRAELMAKCIPIRIERD